MADLSPWGELYAQLLKSERLHRGYTPQQHADNARLRGEQAVQALTAVHESNQERRERVLRHPDLAQQLRDVLGITDAARWNGFVPPAQIPGPARLAPPGTDRERRTAAMGDGVYYIANTSPLRRALVDICAEALRRDTEPAEDVRDAS